MSKLVSSIAKPALSIVDNLTGASGASQAARDAAGIQSAAADKGIAFQKESRDLARADLEPYKKAGASALPGLQNLVNDPNAQKSFIQDNPFFKALTDQATNTLFNNQAAKGKVGSGGTAEALQKSILLLGNDLVNQSIGQKQGLASLGANAASGQAGITQNAGNSISDLYTQQGNAQAAGTVGAANAITEGRMGLIKGGAQTLGAAAGIVACDRRFKTDIKEVGKLNNGLPLYLFRYKGEDKLYINVMAQDVEKVKPEAVMEIDGYKFVNMEEACL